MNTFTYLFDITYCKINHSRQNDKAKCKHKNKNITVNFTKKNKKSVFFLYYYFCANFCYFFMNTTSKAEASLWLKPFNGCHMKSCLSPRVAFPSGI